MCDIKILFEDSPLGVFLADDSGFVSYANASCAEVTGTPADRLRGCAWTDVVQPLDRSRVLAQWQTACGAGQKLDMPCVILRADGSRRFVRVKSRPVPANRPPHLHVGLLIDLTEQVLAERRLRRNNELLSAVLESIPSGITVFDADGSLVLDNQNARRLLHLPEDVEEYSITDFGTLAMRASSRARGDAEALRATSKATPAPRTREEVQPDGRVLEVRDLPMPGGGTVTTYTDISRYKQSIEKLQQAKAEAEQAGAAKAAFLATMSHEIRTPMNGVIGMTNILLESKLTQDQRETLEVIRQSGESLLVVLNDILDYSKIESGQMTLEWLPVRLQEVVDNCVRLLGAKAEDKGVSLSVDVDPSIPSLILGDRTRLQQILMNLISNAVKFTEQGQVCVTVTNMSRSSRFATGAETGDLCELKVCIEDSGIGIPSDKLHTIFEPFVQADTTTARRFGGTGLGLSIARRLVEAMGGEISIESKPARGTKVCFSFLAEAAVPAGRFTAANEPPLWQKTVLLVKGRDADVGVLSTQLRRWGMDVSACGSLAEANTLLKSGRKFDLVVAATHMPEARWRDFITRLRERGVYVPAILLARSKECGVVNDTLRARVVSRSSTGAMLYDAIVEALESAQDRPRAELPARGQFDTSLGARAPLRILVAEDNEINRKVVLRMLAGFGYRADVAQNGKEVIDAVQRRAYDLVLMDIQMPAVDGLEATRFIQEKLEEARRPRVVAMSANVMREDVEAALAAGADAYIAKPFAPSELRITLEESAQRMPRSQPAQPAQPRAPTPPVSQDRIRAHLESDPTGAFLQELIRDFTSMSGDLQARLCEASRLGDSVQVRAIVHEYAGMCAVVGAEKLTNMLMRLQKTARAGTIEGMEPFVAALERARRETLDAFDTAMSGRPHHARRSEA